MEPKQSDSMQSFLFHIRLLQHIGAHSVFGNEPVSAVLIRLELAGVQQLLKCVLTDSQRFRRFAGRENVCVFFKHYTTSFAVSLLLQRGQSSELAVQFLHRQPQG